MIKAQRYISPIYTNTKSYTLTTQHSDPINFLTNIEFHRLTHMKYDVTNNSYLRSNRIETNKQRGGGRRKSESHIPQPQSTRRICRRRRSRRLAARRRPPPRLWTSTSPPSSSSDSAPPSPPIGFRSAAAVLAVADSVFGLRMVISPRMWVPQRAGGGILEAC